MTMTEKARIKSGTAAAKKYRKAADGAINKLHLAIAYAEDGAMHTAAGLAEVAADEMSKAAKFRDKFLEACK